jgi:hypothetical protein
MNGIFIAEYNGSTRECADIIKVVDTLSSISVMLTCGGKVYVSLELHTGDIMPISRKDYLPSEYIRTVINALCKWNPDTHLIMMEMYGPLIELIIYVC